MPSRWADDRRRQRAVLTAGLVVLDAAALSAALILAHRIAASWSSSYAPAAFPPSLWLLIPVAISLFILARLYVLDELLEGAIEYGRVINGCTLASFSLILLGFWGKELSTLAPSRTLIILVWILSITAVGGGRFAARRVVRFLRRRGYLISRAVIVGLGTSGMAFARHFEQVRHAGIQIVGFADDFLAPGTPVTDDLKVLGPPSALPMILAETGADQVIVVPTAMAWESFQNLARQMTSLNGTVIRIAPGSRDLLATSMRAHRVGFIPMLTVERVRIVGLDRVLKTVLDYAVALLALPVAGPVVLLAAAALRASGVRPFVPIRFLGRGAVVFTTVVLNTRQGPARLTALLRRFSLDRLPHLGSVLLGRMSIVGPRPIPAGQRGSHGAWLHGILTVKPGLTGTWAVRPPMPLEDEMELSLFYIRNYTIWVDLEVLVRSVLRRLSGGSETEPEAPVEEAVLRERVAVHR
ncbi:MAG TPA: sugar transferase [bacterium]|nr:sugar transferase [bacterium]